MAQRDSLKIKKALKKKGFVEEENRDHTFYFLKDHKSIFTKISHGSKYKTYGSSLLGKMGKKLKLSNRELLDLIDCPMNLDRYLSILKEKNIL